jgi:hypothetical protein
LLRSGGSWGVQSESTYGNLEHELLSVVVGRNGVQNGRELLAIELNYNAANSKSDMVQMMGLRSIAMVWRWIGDQEKDFAIPGIRRQGGDSEHVLSTTAPMTWWT